MESASPPAANTTKNLCKQGNSYREEFHGGGVDQRILSDGRFVEKMLDTEVCQPYKRKQINFKDLVRHVCKEYQLKEADLTSASRNRKYSEARQVIGWLALKTDNITLKQVAQHSGRDVTTLSRGVRRLEAKIQGGKIAKKLNALYNTILQA